MIHRIIRACLLDGNLYYELAEDQRATFQAFIVVLLGALSVTLGLVFGAAIEVDQHGKVLIATRTIIVAISSWFIVGLFATIIGRLLKRKTRLNYMLSSLGFAYAPKLFSIFVAVAYFSDFLALVLNTMIVLAWIPFNVARGVSRTIDMPFSVGLWISLVGLIATIAFEKKLIELML
ncbi:MAG: hypothetical protein DK304_000761 [Chloroflexi bacterium]|jgi:hypothetical protein|nr:MAG: hypothetical protein DK304_000761 [Chloroflexota bacterium]